ncbi:MAG: nicotinate phosphoribosyltransferase [Planctomycetes bacterium]|nr:nicotinate phosphoribosyltransferase [Planctomycetota bacterium]
MWLMKDTPSLFTDLYELTMAQVYFKKQMTDTAYFEVSVRRLPENWGFFVMAGLSEVDSYLREFRFSKADINFLRSTKLFSDDFLQFLATLKPDVKIRSLTEGTVFFPNEPIFEVTGPLICAQLLESYILNILGFSIIQATLATRISIAAKGAAVVDFGLRRCQGPVASLRSARGAQIAGFRATSNMFAAKELNFAPSGTMAHSFVHVHESQEQSFRNFTEAYGENSILLVDTYDSVEGIKAAANLARQFHEEKDIKIRGIRIDSGDLVKLSNFARRHFQEKGVSFLKIFVSGDLDEFKIDDLLKQGGQIDGFGIGTRFAVSRFAPAIEIIYKIVQYGSKGVFKSSPGKQTRPGRKTIIRIKGKYYERDIISPLQSQPSNTGSRSKPAVGGDDLLKPFVIGTPFGESVEQSFDSAQDGEPVEPIQTIQERLATELSLLDDSIKAIRNPEKYHVEFALE